jgi:hypothetical protein
LFWPADGRNRVFANYLANLDITIPIRIQSLEGEARI